MKKYILLLSIQLFVLLSLEAQVGINTQVVQGIFHIDAASDGSTTNPQIANDVVVNNDGNVGVGTLAPSARLHLKSSSPGGAFRLVDGSQSRNKILLGDKDGNAWWGITKGLGGYEVKLVKGNTTYSNGVTKRFPIDLSNNEVIISNDGSYSFMLRCNIMLMKTGMLPSDVTTQRSRQVSIRYELIRQRTGVPNLVCETIISKPVMRIFDYSTIYLSMSAVDIKKDDVLYINITFLGNSDTDSAQLNLLLDYDNPYSVYNHEAFDTGAIIFYQL